jgi:hypothetical protein
MVPAHVAVTVHPQSEQVTAPEVPTWCATDSGPDGQACDPGLAMHSW